MSRNVTLTDDDIKAALFGPEYSTNIDPNPRSQGHFTRGTVPHQSQLPLLGDRAGDSKAENTAGIAR